MNGRFLSECDFENQFFADFDPPGQFNYTFILLIGSVVYFIIY